MAILPFLKTRHAKELVAQVEKLLDVDQNEQALALAE